MSSRSPASRGRSTTAKAPSRRAAGPTGVGARGHPHRRQRGRPRLDRACVLRRPPARQGSQSAARPRGDAPATRRGHGRHSALAALGDEGRVSGALSEITARAGAQDQCSPGNGEPHVLRKPSGCHVRRGRRCRHPQGDRRPCARVRSGCPGASILSRGPGDGLERRLRRDLLRRRNLGKHLRGSTGDALQGAGTGQGRRVERARHVRR